MLGYPTVRDTMDVRTHALRPSDDVLQAVGRLVDEGVTGAPVTNEKGELVGMLSEEDCLRVLTHGTPGLKGTVGEVMRGSGETVSPSMDIYFVAGRFLAHPDRRRFAVVEDDRLVGVITRKDILRMVRVMALAQGATAGPSGPSVPLGSR